MPEKIFEMQKISKSFPGVQALDTVDFDGKYGEVHALIGENGAGKSTLMKILAGAYRQNHGKIIVKQEETHFSSPREAQKLGISTIYQEFNLLEELTVAENIFLGREPTKNRFFLDKSYLFGQSEKLLSQLGTQIDPHRKIKYLSVAEQQMVEIAKALSQNANIIIMDEPSAVISGKELDSLYRIIQGLKNSGKAIIYISHRLEEIFEIADRATVLKDGKLVGTVFPSNVDKATLVKMMVGRSLSETFPEKVAGEKSEILTLKNITQGKSLKNVSLRVYTGEILGISGLVGSGRTELARIIFGADQFDAGEIYFGTEKVHKNSIRKSISRGIGFVPEDRKKEGLIECLSVGQNITLLILDQIKKWFFIQKDREENIANGSVEQLNIATPDIDQEIQFLSGGNQQKVILARCINANPKVIIMDEPTRGIDVGAKAEVYSLIRKLAGQGTAIIMISSELPEIIGMSDRVAVMHEGKMMGVLSSAEATEEKIMMMATGYGQEN